MIARATPADFDVTMGILREAADWLSARGNPQWETWHAHWAEQLLRRFLESEEFYLGRREGAPVATIMLQWADPTVWGEKGNDGLAGYIHAFSIRRAVGGRRAGERILEWAVDQIRGRDRRYARLDCVASNEALCRYYEARGFTRLGTVMLAPGNWENRLFERALL